MSVTPLVPEQVFDNLRPEMKLVVKLTIVRLAVKGHYSSETVKVKQLNL